MNLKWFFEAQGQMAFWYGSAMGLLQAAVYSLRDPQWSRDLFGWVSEDAIPDLVDLVKAGGEVLFELAKNGSAG